MRALGRIRDKATPAGRRHRRWMGMGLVAALAAASLVIAASASGTLSVGTFDTSNGSLTSDTHHDWNPAGSPAGNLGPLEPLTCPSTPPASGTNCALDLVGSSSDNAFGQGTKEDDQNVTVVDGSIPPNKDDLSRLYINQELGTNGHNLLYLAWERSNLLGSAHMDFELNQAGVDNIGITTSTTGSATIDRTAGDVLIDFDFGGSGAPVLSWHKWVTAATAPTGNPSTDCAASTSFPCWGPAQAISATVGEASVNTAPVDDYNAPVPSGGYNTLDGSTSSNGTVSSTFGEAGIDLQAAGIFQSGVCTAFGDAWLKSRSSGSSFVSALKDFVAPMPVNISNCGSLGITKVSSKSSTTKLSGATFSIYSGSSTSGTPVATATTGSGGTACVNNLQAGTYTVVETAAPTGYAKDPTAQTATVGTTSSCSGNNYTFTDTPLTDVTVHAKSEATGGTQSTISCTNSGGTVTWNSGTSKSDPADANKTGLMPGTYTCTITIDP